MNGLNIMQWNLDDCYSVFCSQLTFVSRLPKPNDSNDYCYRLIYFRSCNNYLTFQVFKTSFNDIMLQSLHRHDKRRRAFWLVLYFWLNLRKFVFCVFQELSSCTCRSCFCSMVENLPATTSFIIFIKRLLCVRSIPWYSSSLSFNSRAIFCTSVVASLGCMAVSSSPFWTVGKKLSQGQIARLSLRIICRCLN